MLKKFIVENKIEPCLIQLKLDDLAQSKKILIAKKFSCNANEFEAKAEHRNT